MAWRTVLIQNAARISLYKGQCQLQKGNECFTFPLEDIIAFILESPEIILSNALLTACQQASIVIITCDDKHMPCGIMHPFHPHSRQSRIGHLQLGWSEPLRKRIWQKLVQQKILNQAYALELKNIQSQRLHTLATQVQSGDPRNIEAQAARYYWQHYFDTDFTRKNDNIINSALNYGYAVIRAIVARSQVAYGLLPAFGVHHCNELNAFNLTDDVMEVLRPFVDIRVSRLMQQGIINSEDTGLSKQARAELASIGGDICQMENGKHTLAHAADLMAQRLIQAIDAKSVALLTLPQLPEPGVT